MKKNLLLILTISLSFNLLAQNDETKKAMDLLTKNKTSAGLSDEDLKNVIVSDSYFDKTANVQMVYLQQSFQGIPVYNQLQVLAFRENNLVSNTGGRIKNFLKLISNDNIPLISAQTAIINALHDRKIPFTGSPVLQKIEKKGRLFIYDNMNVSHESITAELMWVPLQDNKKILLAWQIYVVPLNSSDYWVVRINASNGETISVSNLTVYCNWDSPSGHNHTHNSTVTQQTAHIEAPDKATSSPSIINGASYRVIPYPAESPIHTGGSPTLVTNPWNNTPGNATTLKWHSTGTNDYTISRGNNVWAQEDRNNNNGIGTPATSTTTTDPLTFNFIPNFTVTPTQTTPAPNQQFNITNLFYWNNVIHDIMYQYGFDEVSGNFQASNLNRGGQENDHVLADAQDGGGTNNANFSTPADGGSGRMQMYLWSGNPQKDGDVDNGIICHESTHGTSNRLTGGPSQAGCLQNDENMGEGWSDYYALMLTQNWASSNLNTGFTSPRGIGTYVVGQPATGLGIRSQRYCTDFSVNNKVYASSIPTQVHNRGEIWCATLWDMTWNIINQVGAISPNLYDGNAAGGNVIALRLVTEGMKLQPCSPGFIDGRDAILQADQILYGGVHKCVIWEAFRRRGMGAFASQGSSGSVTDQVADFTLGNTALQLTQSVTQIPEGQLITFTNTLTTDNCGSISNFILTDTLPTNVTYVSGGTYNAANRVVSFPVNMSAGQTQTYSFTVQVNTGSYFPTVTLFQDSANGPLSNYWTPSNTVTNGFWSVSNARSFSPASSYFSNNVDTTSDQKLTLTNAISMGSNPPPLTFRYWLNSESTYDGGVLEASINNGNTWTDMQANIIQGGYIATMDATTLLAGRRAWSGSTNNKWVKAKVNLTPYANNSLKIRFRFTSDVGTQLEGWYVDDIAIKNQALVEMQSNLYTASNVRVVSSDTFTIILPSNACNAVAINTDPSNVTACEGSNTTFSVTAAGSNNNYQWQLSTDGGNTYSNINGANSSSLSLTNVSASQNNNRYRVLVSNDCPSSAISASAILTVGAPAAITLQPTNQSSCGQSVIFNSTATGIGLSYQWQVSTDGGITFSNISGATASSYPVSGPAASLNNNQYHVIVTGCNGSVISSNATLTVNSQASITTQPSDNTACPGGNVVFSASISGTSVNYQWQISTDGGLSFSDIPGETNPALSIINVTTSMNNNLYRLFAVSTVCPGSVTTNPAILIVSGVPNITSQPANSTVCTGSNATFSVAATGAGLSYQWQVSTDGGLTFSDINGANTATLTLNNITFAQNGNQYQAIVNNSCSAIGIVSGTATLTATNSTAISTQPLNVTVCAGTDAQFVVEATGTNISYQWQVSTDGGNTYSDINGGNGNTLTVTPVLTSMSNNRYRVIITSSSCDAVTSTFGTLTVAAAAAFSAQHIDVSVCENANASFSATATGTSLTYQWQVSTDGGNNYNDIAGANSSTLTLSNVTISMNNNKYRLIVTESVCGSLNSLVATLIVHPLPVINISATPSNVLIPGQPVTLTVNSNSGIAGLSWYLNGNTISGQSGSTITLTNNGSGSYYASVTDVNGCSANSATVNIRDSILNYTFIYPNPNRGHFFVRFEGIPFNGQARYITLYDAKGARVFRKSYHVSVSYEPMELNVEMLSTGTYALVLSSESGETLATGKVVIQ